MLTEGVRKLDQEHTLRKSFDAPGVVYRLGHAFKEDKYGPPSFQFWRQHESDKKKGPSRQNGAL